MSLYGESELEIIAVMARGTVGSVSEPYFGSEPVHNSPCYTSYPSFLKPLVLFFSMGFSN